MQTIYAANDFLKILERERARTDRSGDKFSFILFNITHSDKDDHNIKAFGYLIRKRIRLYDDIGWFDDRRLGVLLPGTDFDMANKLAHQIRTSIIPIKYESSYNVLTYPTHWEDKSSKNDFDSSSIQKQDGRHNDFVTSKGAARLINKIQIPQNYMPYWKRAMDICGSLIGIMLLLPVLVGIGLFIKIVSPGPILFRQKRVGFMGRTFSCYKFRTMHVQASDALHNHYYKSLMDSEQPMKKLDTTDTRIIPCGKYLRMSGLDELPQLLNVLHGDMSLIGPRPCIPYEAKEYKRWHRKRFEAVPGITGLWQVNGKNRTTFNEMIRYDVTYALKKNFLLDVMILCKTIPAVIEQILEHKGMKGVRSENEKFA